MLERTDSITNEVLEQITFVLTYPTVLALATNTIFYSFINGLLISTPILSRRQSVSSRQLFSKRTAHDSLLTWVQPGTQISRIPLT